MNIPARKAAYTFCAKFSGLAVCHLSGDSLYVLYSGNGEPDLGGDSFLKCFDLATYGGDEWGAANRTSRNTLGKASCQMTVTDDVIVIHGETPEVLDLHTFATLYSERDGRLSSEWDSYCWLYYFNGKAYRGIAYDQPVEGADILTLGEQPKITGHLDFDIGVDYPWYGEYLAGKRESGTAAVYSAREQRYVFECPLEGYKYRTSLPTLNGVAFDSGRVFFTCGNTLVVGDLETGEILHEVDYLASEQIQAFLLEFECRESNAYATHVTVQGEKAFLACGFLQGYVLCIDLPSQRVVWLQGFQHRAQAIVAHGDLLYGVAALTPTAWDIHTGEQVWAAKDKLDATRAQISEHWLVFSSASGETKCYQLEAPYQSAAD